MNKLICVTAALLPPWVAERDRKYVNERDDLQPTTRTAATALMREWDPEGVLRTSMPAQLTWARTGGIDIAFEWSRTGTTAVELKAGSGGRELCACVWDLTKLAACIHAETVAGGYLVAALPKSLWARAIRGSEFFGAAPEIWQTHALREPFRRSWEKWELEGHIPDLIPVAIRTEGVGTASFRLEDAPWELRVARVEPVGQELLVWPSMFG